MYKVQATWAGNTVRTLSASTMDGVMGLVADFRREFENGTMRVESVEVEMSPEVLCIDVFDDDVLREQYALSR